MVGVGYEGKRNSLARVSLVNLSGNVVYDKNVRPVEFVTDCRTKITGVRVCDLKRGEKFVVVQKEVSELLRGRILVGHALHNDLKVLLLSHPRKDMRDTMTYEHLQSKTGRPQSLKYLADRYLGCKIQENAHSSVEDARAAMFLYNRFKDEWEKHYIRRGGLTK
ncbi:hypothetical protein O6H91_13G007800 [Diphasiastrum complanatum]|nr:hypothetical protein O6H91_13G007800 [Diphasiastrum complanatum]